MLLLRYFLVYNGGVETKMLMGANPLRRAFKKVKKFKKSKKRLNMKRMFKLTPYLDT